MMAVKCSHFFFYIIKKQFVMTLNKLSYRNRTCFTCDFCIYIHAYTYECTTYAYYYNANRSKSTAIITRYYNVYLRVPTRIQIISKTHTTTLYVYI